MSRIEITDLPVQAELSREEQKELVGGWSRRDGHPDLLTAAGTGAGPHVKGSPLALSDSSSSQNGIIAILIGL